MQATYLVRTIRSRWTELDGNQQVPQVLVDYDALSEERRLVCIKQLAELPDDGGLEWLCRLVRFEESPALSKQAALAIITQPVPSDAAAWSKRAAQISKHMKRSHRPAANWLLVDLRLHDDPAGALADWTALTAAERKLLEEHPQETAGGIVTRLLQRTVDLLERQGRSEQVAEVMREIVLCERGDAASLVALIDWLSQRKAWNIVDEVATRFAASFELDALLLYVLCDARQKQGDQAAAEELAAKALKLSGDNPVEHLRVVERLQEQGLTDGADRELRHVIALGPIASPAAINVRLILSDSLHDRLRDQEAADSLKELVDAIDSDPNVMQQVKLLLQQRRKSIDFLRARMYFYLACGAQSRDDAATHRALLEKALAEEPSDLDVLIALYRAGDSDAARRAKLVRTIESVVEDCRARSKTNRTIRFSTTKWPGWWRIPKAISTKRCACRTSPSNWCGSNPPPTPISNAWASTSIRWATATTPSRISKTR